MNRPISVLVLQDAAKGKQVGYMTFRKTDASAVLAYIAELEQRLQDALPDWAQEHPEPDAERIADARD